MVGIVLAVNRAAVRAAPQLALLHRPSGDVPDPNY